MLYMHKKVRQEYNLHVTRNAVYNVMYDLDPEGLEARGGIGAKKKKKSYLFSSFSLLRLVSSVGRAPDCSAGGRGFEPQTGPTLRVLK